MEAIELPHLEGSGKNDDRKSDIKEMPPEVMAGVGEVLWRAQEDIKQMKEEILKESAHDEQAMVKLKGIIEKVESNIKRQTENVVNSVNSRCHTIAHDQQRPDHLLSPKKKPVPQKSTSKNLVQSQKNINPLNVPGGLSPGQQFQNLQKLKAIINPLSKDARKVLNEKYSVPLPALKDQTKLHVNNNMDLPTKKTPKFKSLSADLTKGKIKDIDRSPQITADDAKQGMLFLIERNFIPHYAKISLEPSPVQSKQIQLHSHDLKSDEQEEQSPDQTVDIDEAKMIQYPSNKENDRDISRQSKVTFEDQKMSKVASIRHKSNVSTADYQFGNRSEGRQSTSLTDATGVQGVQTIVPFSTPTFDNGKIMHKFLIQNGKARISSEDFVQFAEFYQSSWGSIISLLKKMEKFLASYSIPLAIIDGDQFVDLALYFEGNLTPTKEDLMTCILNSDDVNRYLMIPGRRYIANDGKEAAAIKIQAAFKRHRDRHFYLIHRKRKWAAGLIALNWIMLCKISIIKKQLKLAREGYLERYKLRLKSLKQSWGKISSSKRTIIHIPSLGYTQQVRNALPNINDIENRQIGRIFEVTDPNVEVIYVWPWHFKEETAKYYKKLLDFVDVNNEESSSVSERCIFISPDAAHRFPSHNMCLSTLLKYSTKSLNRIRSLIKGKTAYIVPGLMHQDDLYIADTLDVPILGCEPNIAKLYSTKSGAKRIFEDAQVDKGPAETDIYNLTQLHESLARLVTEHLNIRRWLLKIDDEISGRGTAFCDLTDHLKCYHWAQKEARRYGEKWNKKWAREAAYNRILSEIPQILDKHAVVVDKKRFNSLKKFLADFLSKGGIIEACPPSDSITSLSVDVLIDPCGNCQILSSVDQIHGRSPFQCLGYTFPQLSIDSNVLQNIVNDICLSCKNRNILGFVSMTFATFIDPISMAQRVWPVDLDLSYSNSLGVSRVLSHITNGSFAFHSNSFTVPVLIRTDPSPYRRRRRQTPKLPKDKYQETERFAVFSSDLYHDSMKSVQSNVLFQLCKSHGIGFDIKAKLGTVFTVIDQQQNDTFGVLTIGESMQETLSSFALNLSLINRDISSNNKQADTNLQDIIRNVQLILDVSMLNMESNETNEDSSELEKGVDGENPKKDELIGHERKSLTPNLQRLPCPSPVTNPTSPL